jgi:thiol:disulfide interchange protein
MRLGACAAAAGLVLAAEAGALSPVAPTAQALVSSALSAARSEKKVVLVEFGASWCGTCRTFDAFLHAPEVGGIMAANYVVVKLAVQEDDEKKYLENPGAEDMMNTWGGTDTGLPFYVFLNPEGGKIGNSKAMPNGRNIGFPGTSEEVEAFVGLLDQTAPRLSAAERATIFDYLAKLIQK